jgi:hypothetical protein
MSEPDSTAGSGSRQEDKSGNNNERSGFDFQGSVVDNSIAESQNEPSTHDELKKKNAELESLVDILYTQNQSLRSDYARARQVSHRQTAGVLVVVSLIAVLGGIVFPNVRSMLFATGAIGVIGSVMTWYLTPGQTMPIEVAQSICNGATTTLSDIRSTLGLEATVVYVPVGNQVRGFLPRHPEFTIPDDTPRSFPRDNDGSKCFTFSPTGLDLAYEVDQMKTTAEKTGMLTMAEAVSEALTEHYEIADGIEIESNADDPGLNVTVTGSDFGSLAQIDNPITSTLACAISLNSENPIIVESMNNETAILKPMESHSESAN